MKNHIIPQVLLKGYTYDDLNKRLKYLEKSVIKKGNKKNLFYQKEFYNDETELYLNKEYEGPYGRIRKKIINSMEETSKEKLILTYKEYNHLIRFYTIMWRRNDEKFMNNKLEIKDLISKQIEKGILPKNINYEKHINDSNLQHIIFERLIKYTTKNDSTVLKTINYYVPILIYNNTEISFPLHSRVSTIHKFDTKSAQFPRILIEPVTNKIIIFFVLHEYKNHSKRDKAIRKEYINDSEIINFIIKLYIIKKASRTIVDDSNVDYVKKLLNSNQENVELKENVSKYNKLFNLLIP